MSILSTNHVQKNSRVAISHGSDPYKTTVQALNHVRDEIHINPGDRIVIKPNIVRPVSPEKGITTDALVVEAIIEYLKDRGVDDVVVAEGGNPGTDKAFKKLGFKKLA